jgi:hypothetical protein
MQQLTTGFHHAGSIEKILNAWPQKAQDLGSNIR